MRLTRSDYLDMARRKLSGNPDATDNEIRDLSEWLFYERDPDGYQKYKTGQVLTEARRLYEEAGLRDAQDVEALRAYNASRAERGHKTLARDVLQGVGLLSSDPDEAHKQVEEWGRYIWSVLSPMGFNRDYHLAQAEHDKLREGLNWRVAMAGDKIVEVETEDGGKGYVLQSELDARERYERELAAFEDLTRLMAQGGDELVKTDQGYMPRSAVEAQQQLGGLARLAALSGDELVKTDQGYMPRSAVEAQQQLGDFSRLVAQAGDELVSTPHGPKFRSDMERRATLSRLAAQVDDELVFTDQGYLPRSVIEQMAQDQRQLGDLARLMAKGGDDLVLTDQGYLPRSAVEAQQQLGDLARLAALSGDELVPIKEQQEQLATQARLAALSGDELVWLPDGFGILQSDLEALPDDLQQQAREHGYFMLKPVEDLTDEELNKRLAVTYPGMDVSELPDNAYVLPTGPPGAALAGALEPLPDDATERERKTRALLVPEAEQEAKEGLQRAAISFIPILSTAMHWNDMSTRWKALSVAGDALLIPGGPGLAFKGALGAAKGALGAAKGAQVIARSAAKPWLQAARQMQQSTYLMPAGPIAPALSSTGRRLPFEGYERIGKRYLEEISSLHAEKAPLPGTYTSWKRWKPIEPRMLRGALWPDSRLPYFPTDKLRRFGKRYLQELPRNILDAERWAWPGTYTWWRGIPIETKLLQQGSIKILPDGSLHIVFDPKKGISRGLLQEPALPLDPASTFLKSEGVSTPTLTPPRTLVPSHIYTTPAGPLSRRMTNIAPILAVGRAVGRAAAVGAATPAPMSPFATPMPAPETVSAPEVIRKAIPVPKITVVPVPEITTVPATVPVPEIITVPTTMPEPATVPVPTAMPAPATVPVPKITTVLTAMPEPATVPVPGITTVPTAMPEPATVPVPGITTVRGLERIHVDSPALKPKRIEESRRRRWFPRLPGEESASPTPVKRRRYPRTVTWLHGPAQFTLDLHTGQESRTYHPNPFNRLPHESFTVASHADTPPPERLVDLGMIDAFVGEHGIRFQLDPAFKRKPIRTQRRPGPLSSRGVL